MIYIVCHIILYYILLHYIILYKRYKQYKNLGVVISGAESYFNKIIRKYVTNSGYSVPFMALEPSSTVLGYSPTK